MAEDHFKIALKCPGCGIVGVADAWQEDGWAFLKGSTKTHVSSLSDGFRYVEAPGHSEPDFYCIKCGTAARKNNR